MEQSLNLINEFLDSLFAYGPFWIYLAIFVAAFVENIMPPFPGDFFTLAGGALAAADRLNIFGVFAVVVFGGLSSTMLVYYLGYSLGRDFFMKKNYRYFSREDIEQLERWFGRHGGLLLVFNRFIVGARAIITLVAGIGHFPPLKAVLFLLASFVFFNGLLLFASYIFVINFETIAAWYNQYEKVALPIIVTIIIILIIWKIYRIRKNVAQR